MRLTRTLTTVLAVTALAGLTLAACDDGDDKAKSEPEISSTAARTIEVEMRDIAFSPSQVEVQAGETIRFHFRNVGESEHDAFLGDAAAQDAHEMDMSEEEHGSMSDDEEAGIGVEPGKTGEIVHTFEAGEELLIGCHEPGHYGEGMKIAITVT